MANEWTPTANSSYGGLEASVKAMCTQAIMFINHTKSLGVVLCTHLLTTLIFLFTPQVSLLVH